MRLPADLDHLVVAADEAQQPSSPSATTVSPDQTAVPPIRRRTGRRPKALAPSAPDRANSPCATSGPAWTSSPGSPGAARAAVGADTTITSANGIARPIDRGALDQRGIEIGRAERFGQAVHRVEIGRSGNRVAQRRAPFAGVSAPPELVSRLKPRRGLRRPFRLEQLHPQAAAPPPASSTPSRSTALITSRGGQIIERRHAPARRPGREQLVLPVIEAQRQHAQHAVGRRRARDNAPR